jgi:acetylornithine deacetylase
MPMTRNRRWISTLIVMAFLSSSLAAMSVRSDRQLAELFDQIDQNTTAHLAFLQQLIRTTQNGEAAVQNLVAERFKALGAEVEVLSILPGTLEFKNEFVADQEVPQIERISVVGTFKGTRNGPSLLFFAHPDNPPQIGLEKWTRDPFGAEIEGAKLYGWGVADDLAGVAIMAEALDAIRRAGLKPGGDIVLCSTPAKDGAQGVIALLDKGYTADAAVYLHPAESGDGMKEIKAVASGMLRFEITIDGRQPPTTEPGKTAFAHLAVNAVDKALPIIRALQDLDARRGERIHHPGLHEAVGRSTNLLIGFVQAGSPGSHTQVPDTCLIGASLTFPPEEKMTDVQKEVEDAVLTAAQADPWLQNHPPQIKWLFGTQGVEIPVDHPLYQTVSNAIQEVTRTRPHVNPLHSASDIRNPYLYSGIPTVGLGPLAGDLAQNGFVDEWVDIADFIRAVKITAKIILDWGLMRHHPSRS